MKIRTMTAKARRAKLDQLLVKAEYYEECFLNVLAEIEEVCPPDHQLRAEIRKLREAHL